LYQQRYGKERKKTFIGAGRGRFGHNGRRAVSKMTTIILKRCLLRGNYSPIFCGGEAEEKKLEQGVKEPAGEKNQSNQQVIQRRIFPESWVSPNKSKND